jgi:adenylate cyclase
MGAAGRLFVSFSILLAGLWGAGLGYVHWHGGVPVLDRIEAPLTDLRFLIQGRRAAPEALTIIAIDDDTVQDTGAFPLPRSTMARLVATVAAGRPKVIALDLLFVAPGPQEGDEALAQALRQAPSVLAAAGLFGEATQFIDGTDDEFGPLPKAQRLLLPVPLLAKSAAVGFVNVTTDWSGTPRHVPLLLRAGDQLVPSFPLRTASIASGRSPAIEPDRVVLGDRAAAIDLGYALPLRFYGPRGTIRTISAKDVLGGRMEAQAVRDRIVVIGATVAGGGDVFPTPFDPVLPGVEVLATAMAHLSEGDGLVRDRRVRLADAVVATILPMLLVLLLSWHRSALGFAVIAVVAVLWIGMTAAVFVKGIWLSATLPLAAAAPPAVLFGAAQLWLDRWRADRLAVERRTLRQFQPPSLTERLARDPDFLAKPVRQEAALVFIDLSGFTGLSEVLGPNETRDVLQGFHRLVDDEAVRHHGVVAGFMGDGAMLLFGLPEPGAEDACHAVEACIALCERARAWLASLPESITSNLGFKIGAHFGTIVASRLGGESHQHITAIGDTVNVASRLMEVAAAHGFELALSDDLYRAAGAACSAFDRGFLQGALDTTIRGRSGSVRIWLWRSRRLGEEAV